MNSETLSTIFNSLPGALTPLIAIIAIIIAWQQRQVEQLKVRLALYDKRFQVYQSVKAFIESAINNGNISSNDLNQFSAKTAESYFLFGSEVLDYRKDMIKQAARLNELKGRIEKARISGESNKLAEEDYSKLFSWFVNQIDESTKLFAEYLKFKKI